MPSTVEIGKTIQSLPGTWMASQTVSLDAAQRQAMLLEILVQFSLPARLDQLMQTITTRVVELIPGAKRGTLLLRSPATDKLVLAAFVATGSPAVSETLARRALDKKEAFVWRNTFGFDPAASIQRHHIQSGMYAPLVYDGEALGVLCVDNPNTHTAFSDEDLQLLVAVADHAAVSVHHQQVEQELSSQAKALDSLLWNFSIRTKAALVEKARAGQLCAGLQRSEVALLAVSFRNLEATLSTMPAAERARMIAAYADAIANGAFEFDGALFTDSNGSVVTVFGAPQKQADANGNAARAAETIRGALAEINQIRVAAGEPTCPFNIAVNCGEVVHGFTGNADRLQFTVIGQALNRTRQQSETGFAEMGDAELKAA
jgi:adenylate cyclase